MRSSAASFSTSGFRCLSISKRYACQSTQPSTLYQKSGAAVQFRALCRSRHRAFGLKGSDGDSYNNALAETINGPYKAEVIHRRGPWRSFEAVEFAPWVDLFTRRRLLEPIGNIPPAEAEDRYYAMLNEAAMPTQFKRNGSDKPGAVQIPLKRGKHCGPGSSPYRHNDKGICRPIQKTSKQASTCGNPVGLEAYDVTLAAKRPTTKTPIGTKCENSRWRTTVNAAAAMMMAPINRPVV